MASFFEASIALSLLVYTVAKDTSRIHDRKRDKKIETHSPSHLRFILKVIPGFSSVDVFVEEQDACKAD